MSLDINTFSLHGIWFIRMVVAALCGCLIGYERSGRNKGAGIRTHAIVSLGAALMMLVSKYGFPEVVDFDPSRIAAQIVTGVGFLGAGVIFVKNGSVSGLTTAAGIWATSGVGMCVGAGLFDIGIMTTLLLVGFQILFHKGFFLKITQTNQTLQLEVCYEDYVLKDIQEVLLKNGMNVCSMKVDKLKNNSMYLEIETVVHNDFQKELFARELLEKPYVKKLAYD